MGMSGISKSQVSWLCEEIDGKVKGFLNRPLEGDWPYLWIDATYLQVARGAQIASVDVIFAIGVNTDGRREILAETTLAQGRGFCATQSVCACGQRIDNLSSASICRFPTVPAVQPNPLANSRVRPQPQKKQTPLRSNPNQYS
jgi:hypothetical protein